MLFTERLMSKKKKKKALFSGVSENTLKGVSVFKSVAMVLGNAAQWYSACAKLSQHSNNRKSKYFETTLCNYAVKRRIRPFPDN